MRRTIEQCWQDAVEKLKQMSVLPRWSHVTPLAESAQRVAPVAIKLGLFGGKSHENLVISMGNLEHYKCEQFPRVIVRPHQNGTLAFHYVLPGPRSGETFVCPAAEGQDWLERYMTRILKDASKIEEAKTALNAIRKSSHTAVEAVRRREGIKCAAESILKIDGYLPN